MYLNSKFLPLRVWQFEIGVEEQVVLAHYDKCYQSNMPKALQELCGVWWWSSQGKLPGGGDSGAVL